MNESSTLTRITELCRLMQEGDRVRVLKFCEAIHQARQGKKEARRSRHIKHNQNTSEVS